MRRRRRKRRSRRRGCLAVVQEEEEEALMWDMNWWGYGRCMQRRSWKVLSIYVVFLISYLAAISALRGQRRQLPYRSPQFLSIARRQSTWRKRSIAIVASSSESTNFDTISNSLEATQNRNSFWSPIVQKTKELYQKSRKSFQITKKEDGKHQPAPQMPDAINENVISIQNNQPSHSEIYDLQKAEELSLLRTNYGGNGEVDASFSRRQNLSIISTSQRTASLGESQQHGRISHEKQYISSRRVYSANRNQNPSYSQRKPYNSRRSPLFLTLEYNFTSPNALQTIQLLPLISREQKAQPEFLQKWWKAALKWTLCTSGPLADYVRAFNAPTSPSISPAVHALLNVSKFASSYSNIRFAQEIPVPFELLQNLSRSQPARIIVIGDVHGCLDEVLTLLRSLKVLPGDCILFLGDMVAKGPRSEEVVSLARDIGAVSVRGNHDEEVIKQCVKLFPSETIITSSSASFSEQIKSATIIQPSSASTFNVTESSISSSNNSQNISQKLTNYSVHRAIAQRLEWSALDWLYSQPYGILSEDLASFFVHAGIHPHKSLWEQEKLVLQTIRSLVDIPIAVANTSDSASMTDETGTVSSTSTAAKQLVEPVYTEERFNDSSKAAPLHQDIPELHVAKKQATSRCIPNASWAAEYTGPWKIYYGHDAIRGVQYFPHAMCLDSGCVYGGNLTAVILPSETMVQVPARRVYLVPPKKHVLKAMLKRSGQAESS